MYTIVYKLPELENKLFVCEFTDNFCSNFNFWATEIIHIFSAHIVLILNINFVYSIYEKIYNTEQHSPNNQLPECFKNCCEIFFLLFISHFGIASKKVHNNYCCMFISEWGVMNRTDSEQNHVSRRENGKGYQTGIRIFIGLMPYYRVKPWT